MSKYKKEDDSDVYSGVVEHLGSILKELEAVIPASSGISNSTEDDFSSLIAFLSRGYMAQIIQSWSYYSQNSNHGSLASVGYKIARTISMCSQTSALSRYGSEIIRDILDHHMKVIYRSLFINRYAVTVSALSVLKEVTVFNKGSHVSDLFSAFDFSLKIIPKLLAADNVAIRKAFLDFYMSFMRNGTFIVRKDLMSQKKCISNWLRNLSEKNELDVVLQTLDVFTECILEEKSFLKSTKISFFNDWVAAKITSLLSKDTSDQLTEKIVDFLRLLCTDQDIGIMFPDSGWSNVTVKSLKPDVSSGSRETNEINNRLVLHVLKFLKPWDDVYQQKLAIDILKCCSELVAPYVSDLFQTISFDPKLTSFWVSYASFISKVCSLPVDETKLLLIEQPSVEVVLNNTLPFRGSSMTKVLQHETAFVRYIGAQTLLFGIRRLLSVRDIYEKKKWDFQQILLEAREQRLPSPEVITQLTQGSKDQSAQNPQSDSIHKTVNLLLVAQYMTLVPPDDVARGISLSENWKKQEINGIETVQIHATLDIQMKIGGLGRWWNKNSGSDYSVFTELLRLGVFNESLSTNIHDILLKLCNPTLLFQTETFVSPVEVLIHSLLPFGHDTKIWKLIDESVARVMRSPYKYVDALAKARNSETTTSTLSPLLVALIEQIKYVEHPRTDVDKWLCKFIRDCCIIGEDWDSAMQILDTSDIEFSTVVDPGAREKWLKTYPTDEYFEFVTASEDEVLLRRSDLVYKLESFLDLEGTKFRALKSPLNLAIHLLGSAAANLNYRDYMGSKNFFMPFLENKNKECARAYFSSISIEMDLKELKAYLAQSSLDSLSSLALWVLDDDTIGQLLEQGKINEELAGEVLRRGTRVPLSVVTQIKEADPKSMALFCSAIACMPFTDVSKESLDSAIKTLIKKADIPLVVALIKGSKYCPRDLNLDALSQSDAIAIIVASSKYSAENIDIMSLDLVQKADLSLDTLPLYTYERVSANAALASDLAGFVASLSGSAVLSLDVVHAIGTLSRLSLHGEVTKKWFNQCFLWLTKSFAEKSSSDLSQYVVALLGGLNEILEHSDIWTIASKRTLNAWLEASLRWFKVTEVLELVSHVVFQANDGLEYAKLLQMITNSDDPSVYSKSAPIIWRLYLFDEGGQVNIEGAIVQKIFKGSSDPNDWILLDVLKRIEAHTGVPWTRKVISWTFVEGDSRLVIPSRDGYEVVFNPKRIRANVLEFHCDEYFEPTEGSYSDIKKQMQDFRVVYDVPKEVSELALAKYNPAFLLYSLISSDLLVEDLRNKIDLKRLVDVNGFSFIITALGSNHFKAVSQMVLQGLSNADFSRYREKLVLQLIIGKLRTCAEDKNEDEDGGSLSPCIYSILAQLVPVLMNPGNFLYEKACDFLMSGPNIKANTIPLYNKIRKSDSETYQREISWILEALTNALQTYDDVKLYLKCGVFEWALALPDKLFKENQRLLVAKTEEIPQGSISLAKRNAGIAYCSVTDEELLKRMLLTAPGLAEWGMM